MFRCFASSSLPPGRCTTTLDDSLPGQFVTCTFSRLDVSHLWTFRYQDVSLPPWMFCHRTTKMLLYYIKKIIYTRCFVCVCSYRYVTVFDSTIPPAPSFIISYIIINLLAQKHDKVTCNKANRAGQQGHRCH